MSGEQLQPKLSQWMDHGLISEDQHQAILQFEQATAPKEVGRPSEAGAPIGFIEVLTYCGVAMMLGAMAWYAVNSGGEVILYGAFATAGLVAGRVFLDAGQNRGSLFRAAMSAWTVGVASLGAFLSKVLWDLGTFTTVIVHPAVIPGAPGNGSGGPPPPGFVEPAYTQTIGSGNIAVGTVTALLVAALLLRRTGSRLLAMALVAGAYVTMAAAMSMVTEPAPNDDRRLAVMGIGVVTSVSLWLAGEWLRTRWRAVADLFAAFGVATAPVVVFIVATDGDVVLQLIAAFVAVAAFGGAMRLNSIGYAVGGGAVTFGFVLDIGGRYLKTTIGVSGLLMVSGVTLLAVALGLVRLGRRFGTRTGPGPY